MENDTLTAPPVEGSGEGTPSQATETTEQSGAQPQSTGVTEVDANVQSASSEASERPKASDFYRSRKEVQALRNMVQDLQKQIQAQAKPQTSDVVPPPKDDFNIDEFWKDPKSYQERREQVIREQIRREILEKDVPHILTQREQQISSQKREQEALELMFPVDSAKPGQSLEDRIKTNPERSQRIIEILQSKKLDILGQTAPKEAAELALMIYEREMSKNVQPRNPAAPKKGQLVSTATGVQTMGGIKKMNYGEIKTKIDEMNRKMSENPEIRFDDKFVSERALLKEQLSKLAKEQGASA